MQKTEFFEQLLYSDKPSEYFTFLKKNNLMSDFFELQSLIITPQDPRWHPEGSVWTHTLMVVDIAAEFRFLYTDELAAAAFMFGALCHDFGKPYTSLASKGKIRSPMHDSLGVPPAVSFLCKLNLYMIQEKVCSYIIEHLKPTHLYNDKKNISDKAIIKLAKRIDIYDIVNLSRCDHWGRTDSEATNRIYPAGEWLLKRYEQIKKRHLLSPS